MKSNNGTRKEKQKTRDGIFFSKQTLDMLLRHERGADMIALLVFYHYTGCWQRTNQPHATVAYVAKGLRWGKDKVRAVRSLLLDHALIEDVRSINPVSRKASGWFVGLKYFHPLDFSEGLKSTLRVSQSVVSKATNALRSHTPNALSPDKKLSKERNRFSSKTRCPSFLEGLAEHEREIVTDYNETLVPLGWIPVTKVTEKLRECLEAHWDAETWHELIQETADARDEWPKRRRSRTIFRVGWDNY